MPRQRCWPGSGTCAARGATGTCSTSAGSTPTAATAAARTGALDLNLLLLDGRPVSFVYNYHYRGQVYGLRMGYDPAMGRLGPGSVLQRLILEDGFRRGDRQYDLGVGSMDCQRYWRTSVQSSYRCRPLPAGRPAHATATREALVSEPALQRSDLRGLLA